MQKSASPASVALRLNNLEQRFDELENPEPPEPDRTLVDKLARMTIVGAELPGAFNSDWSKNQYWFDDGISLARSLYGTGQFSTAYPAVLEAPFYQRVFGNSTQFGRPSTNSAGASTSLAFSLFGGTSDFDAYFSEVEDGYGSVAHRTFTNVDNVAWLKEQEPFSNSLFGKIFGSWSAAQAALEEIEGGEAFAQMTNLLQIILKQHRAIQTLSDRIYALGG